VSLERSEFTCKCGCGENNLTSETFSRFWLAEDLSGIEFDINSGYRCPEYNRSKKIGSSDSSSHPKGMAGDVDCRDSWKRWKIVFALHDAGFTRIRIGKTFIHADTDRSKAEGTLGLYK